MTRSLRILAAAAAAQLALSFAPMAGASATIYLSDANCDDFTLSGAPGARTLTCVVSTPPTCTVSATNGSSTATFGTAFGLQANCSPAATSVAWTGGNCATGFSCSDTQTQVPSVSYTVQGTNGNGQGPVSSPLTITWSAAPPPAPTGCTLSASPASLPSAGGTVLLTATCSGGGTPTDYAWTGSGVIASTKGNQQSISVKASSSFTVTPSNSGTAGNTASTSVSVASVVIGAIDCGPSFSATKVIDATFPAAGAVANRYFVTTAGIFSNGAPIGFYANDAVVVRFTAPAVDSSLSLIMYGTNSSTGPATLRTATLSTAACDFAVPASREALYADNLSQTITLSMRTDGQNSYGYENLVAGRVYYVNVKNSSNGINTCTNSTGRCDVYFSFTNPR